MGRHKKIVLNHGGSPIRARPGRIEPNRNLLCPHYNACLDHVIAKHWSGWACDDRCVFQGVTKKPEYAHMSRETQESNLNAARLHPYNLSEVA